MHIRETSPFSAISAGRIKAGLVRIFSIAAIFLTLACGSRDGCNHSTTSELASTLENVQTPLRGAADEPAISIKNADPLAVGNRSYAYADDLSGWILEALNVMQERGIPGSYEGIHRTIMRESGGDPNAINLWDSNAARGIPSKGLMQVIDPTFLKYHVEGTSWDIFNPVANIVAACNYAADRYGTIDNVFSAY